MHKTLLFSLIATSCSFIKDPNLSANNPKYQTSLWNIDPEAIECKDREINTDSQTRKSFICDFEAFDIEVIDLEQESLKSKETLIKVYEWMIKTTFHGSEIYALEKVVFDGDSKTQNVLGSYDPRRKIIQLFPNNPYARREVQVLKWVAERLGKEEITTYDWEYWQYTLSHEYGHHQTVVYGSENQTPIFDREKELADFKMNDVGAKFLNSFLNLKKSNNKPSIEEEIFGIDIAAFSSGRNGCESKTDETKNKRNIWPLANVSSQKNNYYWTAAERMTRAFQTLTYQVPKEFHNPDSVSAYGTIADDYWWFNHYKANLYENFLDEKCEPLQKELDIKLSQFAKMMKEEWFNEKDKDISAATFSGQNQLYLFTTLKGQKIELVSGGNKILLKEKPSFTKTHYNWRPFDSRKSVDFAINSIPYHSEKPILAGKYEILINDKKVDSAFDLKVGEMKDIGSNKASLDRFSLTKEGLFLEVIA